MNAPFSVQTVSENKRSDVLRVASLPVGVNGESSDQHKLEAAFEFFNQMSEQLSTSYQALEQQIQQLTEELAQAEARHEQEVADRERVTGRLEGLLHILPAGVVLLDVRGRVQECNAAATDLLGEPLLGELWLDIIKRCFAPRLDDGHEISLKDGRRVSIATRSLEVEPGQLIVLTDMTETRVMQERLNRHQRLSELGRMVASLAHQIRTPLSAAMLYGEHLMQPSLQPGQQTRFAGKLMSRLNHLEQQVRDMLIFARGDIPLADISTTAQLVADLKAAMEVLLESSQSRCELINNAPGVRIQCNHEALVGAILNLVDNAIQAAGAEAELKIQMTLGDNRQLAVLVADQGPGIEAALLDKVADPFVSTKSHGTGLGLSVVQAVVRAHHGEFCIASVPGEGTQITLLLPIKS